MRKINKKRLAIVAGGTAVVMAGAGVGYAYWTSDGTGTGTASTAAGNATAFSVGGDVPDEMYPGDDVQRITATVTNDGSENYKIQKLEAYLTIDAPHATAGCSSADYLLNNATAPGTAETAADLAITPIDLAPDGTQSVDYTIQFNNNTDANQDACKGALVSVNYIAS